MGRGIGGDVGGRCERRRKRRRRKEKEKRALRGIGEVLRGPGSVGSVTMASTAAALLGSRWRGRGEREKRRTGAVN
ncbi:hypothetical protein Droror1_Dr00016181 [Drosera rotundifolia]